LLYLFIYVIIQLQDDALLFGSIGLFVLLTIIMYFSRKVNWNPEDKSRLSVTDTAPANI
jgi:inner membrane protein